MKDKLMWFFKSFIWLGILLFVIDLVTKLVVMNNMYLGQSITLIPGFVSITYVVNPNAAFGMGFKNPDLNRWMYVVVALLAIVVLVTTYVKKYKDFGLYLKACLILIITGAFGNLIDRLFYSKSGYAVVDWIDFFTFKGSPWVWNFNIADSCIVIGTIMIIVFLIIEEVKEFKAQKANEPKVEGKVLSKEEKERIDRENNKLD